MPAQYFSEQVKVRAGQILTRLKNNYPELLSALNWETPWELMVATILAAQCTDARVNLVTPGFFQRWPGPADLAQASLAEIEEVIRSTGFYHHKAKHLKESAAILVSKYGGQVPTSMPELLELPGVARKTANIVLSHAFGLNAGIAVDTHVKRLSFRMGLTTATDPNKIEQDLMPLFNQADWGMVNHAFVYFGHETCQARKPLCQTCLVSDLCPKCGLAR